MFEWLWLIGRWDLVMCYFFWNKVIVMWDLMEVIMYGRDSSIDWLIKIRINRLEYLENIMSFGVWMDLDLI